jgi:hypothetical protein
LQQANLHSPTWRTGTQKDWSEPQVSQGVSNKVVFAEYATIWPLNGVTAATKVIR